MGAVWVVVEGPRGDGPRVGGPCGGYWAGDGARLLCLEVGRGFGAIGSSSKKLLLFRREGMDGFWETEGGPWDP